MATDGSVPPRRNGRTHRGPGRPPGKATKPNRPQVPRREGITYNSRVFDPDFTVEERLRISLLPLEESLERQQLLADAKLGSVPARVVLRERYNLTLPLVEASQAQLTTSAVLSSHVSATSLLALTPVSYTVIFPPEIAVSRADPLSPYRRRWLGILAQSEQRLRLAWGLAERDEENSER
jgi:hypothetical protein